MGKMLQYDVGVALNGLYIIIIISKNVDSALIIGTPGVQDHSPLNIFV